MGHGGNMGHVDFTYFCDNYLDVVNYSDNKGDQEHFLLAGYSKYFEIWGFLLRRDAKLCCI